MKNKKPCSSISVFIALLLAVTSYANDESLSVDNYACDSVPRPENASLPLSAESDDWYQVYESADGVFSIVEPYQLQETISHLIVGKESALLFDTGIGLIPLRPVVERITNLPVIVLNSHTHYDHVGGNWEFDTVLAVDSVYTRANMAGFENSRIAGDFLPEAFCKGAPEGAEIAAFHTKPWMASGLVKDGEMIDLGGRTLEVLHVPGHTPDALALLDAENRLLFTGDTWYDASLWLFVRETNLEDYVVSISRLAELESKVDFLLGAHNLAIVEANRLKKVDSVTRKIRSGTHTGEKDNYNRLAFDIDGVRILTSQEALNGKQGDISRGGSGLDRWPTR
jgi:glyoxylase-like metal-dependent hydrolase (beta-lactamase superfamily II)